VGSSPPSADAVVVEEGQHTGERRLVRLRRTIRINDVRAVLGVLCIVAYPHEA
jgi:hypothetical protein